MEARRPPLIAVPTPQEQAATELAKSGSPRRAARVAGVPLDVVKLWQKDPEFAALVLENRSTDLILTVSTLMSAGPMAAQTLVDQLGARKGKRPGRGPDAAIPERQRSRKAAPTYSDPRKIRAARIILDNIFRFAETIEFMERIKALEEKARVSYNAGVPLEGRVIDLPSTPGDDETTPVEPPTT